MKIYNFSAGPSMIDEGVMRQAQREFTDYNGSGMGVVEMSHRGKLFEDIHNEGISLLRELMNISDDYHVLFMQGGATGQFDAVPLNLMSSGNADYIVTGYFSEKAYKHGQKYGKCNLLYSGKDKNYVSIPDVNSLSYTAEADYVHITSNNTIFGTQYNTLPDVDNLVCDMSSNILGKYYDTNKFLAIYAGAQKNIGPAGLTVVIVKKSAVGNAMAYCPAVLDYKDIGDNNSLFNTPPTFSIYMAMLSLRALKAFGGIKAMEEVNTYKANLIYNIVDEDGFYSSNVAKPDRSIMNVPFVTPLKELDDAFIKEAAAKGLVSLKGHRLVGGMRASIYNGMPVEGVESLAQFMKDFAAKHK